MPGNVAPAVPSGVYPHLLFTQFTEELRYETQINQYPDGASQRQPLSINPRYYFKFAHKVTAAQWAALRTFYLAHRNGQPFYFYDLRNTAPPGSYDPSGANTIGRYTVVLDGTFTDQLNTARSVVSIALREVA